jgi:hypothetical protein
MKTISVTVIDTLNYTPSIKALRKTLDTLGDKITSVYWFSDIPFPEPINTKVFWTKIPKITSYNDDYGNITLKICPVVCIEDFNLIIHSDGFAVNRDAWTDEFFEYDYIGATWQDGRVGNGGFCLRSRKLYNALNKMNVNYATEQFGDMIHNPDYHVITNGQYLIPEDNVICKIYRNELETKYGIKFAPPHIANRFSVEHNYNHEWVGRSLGFHGKHGIAKNYGVEL